MRAAGSAARIGATILGAARLVVFLVPAIPVEAALAVVPALSWLLVQHVNGFRWAALPNLVTAWGIWSGGFIVFARSLWFEAGQAFVAAIAWWTACAVARWHARARAAERRN